MPHPIPRPLLRLSLGLLLCLGTGTLIACDNPSDESPDASAPPDSNVSPDSEAPPELHSMAPAELDTALVNKDFVLINVHIPYEGEIPGTDTHIAFTDVDALVAYIGPDPNTAAVLYCKTDYMADIAGPELVARGYRAITTLSGGMNAWVSAGFSLDP
jgi:rhodanese-related sulfurtransferase